MDQLAETRAHKLTIRGAAPDDLGWILTQLKEFSEFMGTAHPLFGDEEYAADLMLSMMREHLLLVADKEGQGLVGLVAGFYLPHPFNPKIRSLTETFFWVAKEFRQTFAGGLAATRLLDEFVAWGQKRADQITFSREMHSPFSERNLIRRGFRQAEQTYILEVI